MELEQYTYDGAQRRRMGASRPPEDTYDVAQVANVDDSVLWTSPLDSTRSVVFALTRCAIITVDRSAMCVVCDACGSLLDSAVLSGHRLSKWLDLAIASPHDIVSFDNTRIATTLSCSQSRNMSSVCDVQELCRLYVCECPTIDHACTALDVQATPCDPLHSQALQKTMSVVGLYVRGQCLGKW